MGYAQPITVDHSNLAIEKLPVAAYFIDKDGFISGFNQKARDLWGRSPEAGERWCGSYKLFTPAGLPIDRRDCPMAQYLRDGMFPPTGTALLQRPDGDFRMIKPHPSLVKGENGEIIGFMNVVIDVTDLEPSSRISDSEEMLTSVLSSNSVAFTVFDYENRRVTKANDSCLRLMNHERADLDASTSGYRDFMSNCEQLLDAAAIDEARVKGCWSTYEKRFDRPDGRSLAVRVSSAPITALPGHCLVCIEDLTAHKETEQENQILKSEVHHLSRLSAMGTMTAILAHEVAHPFSIIKNALFLIENDEEVGKQVEISDTLKQAFKLIKHEADRGHRLVERMRNFSRPDLANKSKVIIRDVIDCCVEMISLRFPGLCVNTSISRKVGCLIGDPVQIEQVLLNVMRNAAEAMDGKGFLQVDVRQRSGSVIISIADEGTGFSDQALATAFTPFKSTKMNGTGLGLSICRSILEQHGGTIAIVPRERGSCITMRLPSVDQQVPTVQALDLD
ncbi:ATP-binding protein [Sphingomonas kaistensis]|uniref:histidine kinase n=1 Tax=Sphingomonas kaistensis TaxID=298708 RepID=A0ABZ2G1R5_9SPHN